MKLLGYAKVFFAKFLPRKFVKHYIRPFLIRRKQLSYDAKRFFESYYQVMLTQELSDGATIKLDYDPLFSRYHYNAVENSIIEVFSSRLISASPQVLDIGSGAGHWIDFYLDAFRAKSVVGVDISKSCVDALCQKYNELDNVHIFEANVSSSGFRLERKFDIINAIGIIFHIVDDALWRQSIENLANHLRSDGVMIIGGQFGWITRNVQFHDTDEFSSWEEQRKTKSKVALVNKRIRSLRLWRDCCRQAGLQIDCVQRTRPGRGIRTPENNVLVLSHIR